MSSPFQLKFMAKNPVKGFTMAELERRTRRAEKKMEENAAILPQIEGPGNPDFESKDPQEFAGDDTHTYGKKNQVSNGSVAKMVSPLNAYVSTAPHFQRMQDNIAAAFTPKKETGPTSEDKKNQAEEDYWKSITKASEEPETKIAYDKAIESGVTKEQMDKVFDAGSTIGKFI
jgi:hypothetical protein